MDLEMPSKVLILSLGAPSDPKQCSRIQKDYSVLDVRPQPELAANDIKIIHIFNISNIYIYHIISSGLAFNLCGLFKQFCGLKQLL